MLVAVLDFAGQRRYVIMRRAEGNGRPGTTRCAVRLSVPRRSGRRTWLPLAGPGAEPGLLRWS